MSDENVREQWSHYAFSRGFAERVLSYLKDYEDHDDVVLGPQRAQLQADIKELERALNEPRV